MTLDLDLIGTMVEELDRVIANSVDKSIMNLEEFGILFSGGLDSSLLAKFSEDKGKKVILYTIGLKGSPDLEYARMTREAFKSPIKVKVITPKEVEDYAREVISVIKNYNPMDVSIGIPFYIACKMARENGVSHILCGQGADELFGGYHRYLKMSKEDLQAALNEDIKKARVSTFKRDHAIAKANSLKLLTPFLDPDLVKASLKIPVDFKIRDGIRKFILREVAKKRGLPDFIVNREKKAIQYSTGVNKVLRKLAKRENKSLETYCKDVYALI
ncbi:MAG: asparagine synthase C-terminal domain-containing protein [Candidatus Hydrothermarchaeales archaeon]